MSRYTPISRISVGLDFGTERVPVGQLASHKSSIYFEYDRSFVRRGIELSPHKLPLGTGLRKFDSFLFDGLPGVLYDSLPDGWGRLLLDRILTGKGILPSEFSALDRLAHVGTTGLGALVYEPDHSPETEVHDDIQLDILAAQTQSVLHGESDSLLLELLELNGSSAGARPKALIGVSADKTSIIHGASELPDTHQHWLVKFPNSTDGADAGAIEYVYALMAQQAGVAMSPTHLFGAQHGAGHFATQRFDRRGSKRWHLHTASGLLHSDFRTPVLDYENLTALTEVLTKDIREVKKMYRMAVFNVLSHNRDDHGKNFSFLMNQEGEWITSPAYDLTFSSGPRGHQSTMVMGEGHRPSTQQLTALGAAIQLTPSEIQHTIAQTREALSHWPQLAKTYGVNRQNAQLIQQRIEQIH